jgi:hypothetical protein
MKFFIKDGELTWTGKFPESKEKAIEASIQKWTAIAEYLSSKKATEVPYAVGHSSCALCRVYWDDGDRVNPSCTTCPVRLAGHNECSGTPCIAYEDFEGYENSDARNKAAKYAKQEVKFLKSL